jgi:phosphoribosylformylglycinamidine synthase
MAMASGIGAAIDTPSADPIPAFFGEDQGRYLLTLSIRPDSAEWEALRAEQQKLGIAAALIGTTGGAELKLGQAHAISVEKLVTTHESWFPRFMGT